MFSVAAKGFLALARILSSAVVFSLSDREDALRSTFLTLVGVLGKFVYNTLSDVRAANSHT